MHNIIISDSSCLIILSKIDELHLLNKVYGIITTTKEIAEEFGENLPEWIQIIQLKNIQTQAILELQIDKGESSAIALALEVKDCTLILDDIKARRIAEKLNLKYTGTLGIIIKAKLLGIIPSIKPILEKIKATNFRITPALEYAAIIAAKE